MLTIKTKLGAKNATANTAAKGKRKQWSTESMRAAVKAVEDGMSEKQPEFIMYL